MIEVDLVAVPCMGVCVGPVVRTCKATRLTASCCESGFRCLITRAREFQLALDGFKSQTSSDAGDLTIVATYSPENSRARD